MDRYLRMVHACAERDRRGVVNMSVALGFLTGRQGVGAMSVVVHMWHQRDGRSQPHFAGFVQVGLP